MKLLIADDDVMVSEGLKLILELEDDFEVVGIADNGKKAFDLCKDLMPDLVLMDIRMPEVDGVLGTKLIKGELPDIKVVILTTFKDDEYIKEAIKSGAEGYILKNQSSDNIIESLRAVSKGSIVFEKEVAQSISTMLKTDIKKVQENYNITKRELEVLQLVGEGFSNKEIADKLFLSEGTARNYVAGLLLKFGLRDRTQLAIFYLKNF